MRTIQDKKTKKEKALLSKSILCKKKKATYLNRFKHRLKSDKGKFRASMKLAFKCLQQNWKIKVVLPPAFYLKMVSQLLKSTKNYYFRLKEIKGREIDIHIVNAKRNMVAVKNAFMGKVIFDSLNWAKGQIKEEIGEIGKRFQRKREEIQIQFWSKIEKSSSNKILEENENDNKESENFNLFDESLLNKHTEDFVNQPIQNKHLTGKKLFIITKR